ncbi:SDR family oxidoreductase [Sphingomonas pokkalii]|uniref:NAD(P)-dependent oxidoreductase n=1 Tax=Sphingomonas pokkalii TaxID=2175090 RepID=A0A2U0SFT2_9SPHN|nr:SDR family oxidoreductase [Sphingomonas pokkalii]PVX30232.1 NAD(P)-dependent oxidoreductase [Sphingomonas pokkalii]
MYAVTGASGQLGRLVVEALLGKVAARDIVALVRNPESVADFAAKGVVVRVFDYDAPETLAPALAGVTRLLLISGNAVGSRVPQHRAVIDAAKAAGVALIAYTSILHGQASPMALAAEHKATEDLLAASGLPTALLRNGWYTENYLMGAGSAIAHGVLLGSAGDGVISAASRADYAEAAAVVLTRGEAGTFELAGDSGFTLAELAGALAEISGKPVAYQNLSQADYAKALEGAGLPGPFAAILADSDARAGEGALFDDSHTLSSLIGRPTTPWRETVAAGVRG